MTLPVKQTASLVDDILNELKAEIDQSSSLSNEMATTLEQSRYELAKLTQKNATITGHLQQMQPQLENMPRNDIKIAYVAALDTQQRMLLMRSQIEKIQNDQAALQKHTAYLEKILKMLNESGLGSRKGGGTVVLEMVMDAQESERRRLSNQMHDGPAQTLSNLIVQVEIASKLFDIDQSRAREELSNLKESAKNTLQKVRTFIAELRPMMLDDLGVFPTLDHYINSFRQQNQVDITYRVNGQTRRLEPYLEAMLFRAAQELVGNACRHNRDNLARLKIDTQVVLNENLISVTVSDNGCGFDTATLTGSNGLGLKLIRERVETLGGQMQIESKPGQGVIVSFQVPCLELDTNNDIPKF